MGAIEDQRSIQHHILPALFYELESQNRSIDTTPPVSNSVLSMATSSLYTHYENVGRLLKVHVDDVNILLPTTTGAIGTKGLNGCTCVVILGTAIIMAHISPLPGKYSQLVKAKKTNIPQLGRDHHDRLMARVKQLYETHRQHFPPNTTAWGIFSLGSDGLIKSAEKQIRTSFAAMGHEMKIETYREMNPARVSPPKGEVVGCMKGDERLL
jgi:hypothetical protein